MGSHFCSFHCKTTLITEPWDRSCNHFCLAPCQKLRFVCPLFLSANLFIYHNENTQTHTPKSIHTCTNAVCLLQNVLDQSFCWNRVLFDDWLAIWTNSLCAMLIARRQHLALLITGGTLGLLEEKLDCKCTADDKSPTRQKSGQFSCTHGALWEWVLSTLECIHFCLQQLINHLLVKFCWFWRKFVPKSCQQTFTF